MSLDPQPRADDPYLVPEPLLEVVVLHPRDAEAATAGQADRLLAMTEPAYGGRSPEPAAVSAILRETDLPVRVLLRLDDELGASGDTLARLVGLARDYLELGAEGVSFGFLDRDLEIDRASCAALALPAVPIDLVLLTTTITTGALAVASGRPDQGILRDAAASVFRVFYIGLPLGALAAIRSAGREALLLLMLTVVVSDSAQYYTGRAFGRHLLAPERLAERERPGGAAFGGRSGAALVSLAPQRVCHRERGEGAHEGEEHEGQTLLRAAPRPGRARPWESG